MEPKMIRVRVTPGTKREYLIRKKESAYEAGVSPKAEAGEANARLRELIAERFSVPVKNVVIASGRTGHSKMVRIYPYADNH